jgi:hypothetical protein
LQFDQAYDQIDGDELAGPSTDEEISQWVSEVIPMFSYEGVSMESLVYYPKSVEFEFYRTGYEHNHILGRANCLSLDITLNARYANPASSLNGDLGSLSTLVHELAHAQGICMNTSYYDSEVSAQLVTVELLSSLANKGNRLAFAAVVAEMRDMMYAAAWYEAMESGDDAQFQKLTEAIYDTPFEQAQRDKTIRRWTGDEEKLQEILLSYNYLPMVAVLDGMGTGFIDGVQLPINMHCSWVDFYAYIDPEASTECIEEPLFIDDLIYVMEHVDELAAGFNE